MSARKESSEIRRMARGFRDGCGNRKKQEGKRKIGFLAGPAGPSKVEVIRIGGFSAIAIANVNARMSNRKRVCV